MWRRLALVGVSLTAVFVAVVAVWRTTDRPGAHAPAPPGAHAPAPPPAVDQLRTLTLKARARFETMVGYGHLGPPPWPTGNCFALSTDRRRVDAPMYWVVNMHAENFARVVDSLGLVTVEVLELDDKRCLITDARIPREWLLAAPCEACSPPALRQRLRESHADRFSGSEYTEQRADD